MAGKTNYLETAFINHCFRGVPFTKPTGLWVGLFSVAPTDAYDAGAPTGTEFTIGVNGYQRAAYAPGYVRWEVSGPLGRARNKLTIQFATPTGNWGGPEGPQAFGIFDSANGGRLLYHGPIPYPVQIVASANVSFLPNTLAVYDKGNKSDGLSEAWLNHVFGDANPGFDFDALGTAWYFGLRNTAPTSSLDGAAPGGNYQDQQLTSNTTNYGGPAGTPRATSNSVAVAFPVPSVDWTGVRYYHIRSTALANCYFYGELVGGARDIVRDSVVSIPIGDFDLTED